MTKRRWLSAVMVVACCSGVFAQSTAEAEAAKEKLRQKQLLIESIAADGRELRLAENRAILLARLGNKVWAVDQKRADDLFQDAVAELLAAQSEAEAERLRGRQGEFLNYSHIRPQLLQLISARNADLALQSLYRTRPFAVERAMTAANPKDNKIRSSPGNDFYLAQNELQLEQMIARQAADQNPERSVALLKTVLKKGVTGEALSLLRKIYEKDPATAAELGEEVANRLTTKDLIVGNQVDYNSIQTAISFLNDHIQKRNASERVFRFAPSDMKSLTDKLVTFFLGRTSQPAYGYLPQMVPIVEKMRPGALEKINELSKTPINHYGGLRLIGQDPETAKLLNGETPVEEVLAKAPGLPIETRGGVYQTVANRLAAEGNIGRARQIVIENFSDDALTSAQESLNWSYIHQLINQGKYNEAEVLIDESNEQNRFSGLISLADAMYGRDMEANKPRAIGVLAKAANSLPARPENSNEMQQFISLIAAYTRIEPAEAFRILDGLAPQINELAEASVVVSGFQGTYNFRRGEMVLTNGYAFGVNIDGSVFRGLAQKDFDRTLILIGTFSRREMRVAFKQSLLDHL
ncbi:MAG: hypothetical protein ACT4O9_05905 [Blastocatellia bacterium]